MSNKPTKAVQQTMLRGRFSRQVHAAENRPEGAKSMAQKQFAHDADVNNLWKRFKGPPPQSPTATRVPSFRDFTNVPTFLDQMNAMAKVRQDYEALPAKVRKRFHSPLEIIMFLQDPNNEAEAIKLGFIPKPPIQPKGPPQHVKDMAEAFRMAQTPPEESEPSKGSKNGLPKGDRD